MRRTWVGSAVAAAALALVPAGAGAATIQVNTTLDEIENNQTCGLREAVTAANDNADFGGCDGDAAGADVIVLQGGSTYVLTRHVAGDDDTNLNGDLDILGGGGTTIRGSGPGLATIDANSNTVPGDDTLRNRAIDVRPNAGGVTLERLRVRAGVLANGGGGGGISTSAPLTVIESEVVDNAIILNASSGGGGIAVLSPGSLTLTRSTVAGNLVRANPALPGDSARGGGILAAGDFTARNSTISGNTVNSMGTMVNLTFGGGIYWLGFGDRTMSLTNVTIANNTATAGGGQTSVVSSGGIFLSESNGSESNTTLANTILAGNTAPNLADCGQWEASDDWISGGNNVLGDSDGCDPIGGVNDVFFANPGLGILSDYGGPTRTQILNAGSPAINRGGTCPETDQRGLFRAAVAPCDTGAFELGATAAPPAGPSPPGTAARKKCKKRKAKKGGAATSAKKCKKKRKRKQ
jgi:CSLREA domain-containing protein